MEGARVPILQVGISGFRLPLRFVGPDGEDLAVETKVTGTVSLDADKKGLTCPALFGSFTSTKRKSFRQKFSPRSYTITKPSWIQGGPHQGGLLLSHDPAKSSQRVGGVPVLRVQF